MRLQKRTVVAVALALTLATSGCLGFLSGTTAVEAEPAVVAQSAASDAGYEKANTSDITVEREFSAAGQTRTVQVTNWAVEYQKSVSVGPLVDQKAAVFATFTSPEVGVLGQSFNPLSELSTKQLAQRMQGQYSGLTVGEEVERRTVSVTGTQTNVSKFEGTATFNGQEVDVYIVVSEPVEHEGDYVVATAVYPRQMDGEFETVLELMRNLDHPADATSSE